ncbi:MAG: hypothetical protein AB8B56_18730 [Crocinitomicaceae bacterium]
MNTKSIITGIFSLCLISGSAFAQEREVVESSPASPEQVKAVKKEIRKEVQMEDKDGVKTLTITTDDGGEITKEVFTGAEAEAKLAELMPQMEEVTMEQEVEEERIEVAVDDDGNLESVTIKRTRNGEETIEVLEGEAAEKKLEEIKDQVKVEIEDDKKGVKKKKVKRSSAKKAEASDM